MKLYLAGPMTGLPDFNYPTFNRYARLLRELGHVVFNPAEAHDGETGLPLEKYFELDLPEVCRADAVAVLPGWRKSRGAQIEVDLARHLGKNIYDAVLLAGKYGEAEALLTEEQLGFPDGFATDDEYMPDPIPGHGAASFDADAVAEQNLAEDEEAWGPPSQETRDMSAEVGHVRVGEAGPETAFVFYEHDPERHTSEHGGVKDNVNKPRVDLIPSLPLFKAGEVLAFGARKYKPHNWRLGLSWLETYGSLQRHLLAWLDGEENDRESGYSHMAHAVCQMLFLAEFYFRGTGTDDRFVSIDKDEVKGA